MNRLLMRCTLALVAILGIACSNPVGPDPVCIDPKANNQGQPLPCQYGSPAPVFTETKIWLVDTTPTKGSTVFLTILSDGTSGSSIAGSEIMAKVGFEIAEEHLNKAKADGKKIYLTACFFNNGRRDNTAGCGVPFTLSDGMRSGVLEIKRLKLHHILHPRLERTEFVWLFAVSYSEGSDDEKFVADPVPVPHHFIWKVPE